MNGVCPGEQRRGQWTAGMVHQVVLIQNGVYRLDSLESDALPHRAHVFARFAPGAFLFRLREVIATRLTSVRLILALAPQSIFAPLSTDRLRGRTPC